MILRHPGSRTIVVACFIIQAVGIGSFVSYGVFFNYLVAEFHWSRAVVSGASSLAFFLSGIFAMAVGRLSDSYGPKILMGGASIFFGAGFMLMSRVTEVWQLYLFYGVLFGIGLSAIDVIALSTTARWFSQSRGMMTGIVKVGTGAGQFTVPFVASILITLYGWRHTYLIIGGVALILLLLISRALKPGPDETEKTAEKQALPPSLCAREAMKTAQLWFLCSANMLLVFCLLIVLVHIVPHGVDLGLSPTQAAGVLSTIGAVSMLGRFVSGMAIDRIGSKMIMVVCFFILIAALLWLQFAHSLWMLYLFGAVYGLAHGGFFTAISPIVAEIFGIASHGAIFGIVVFSGTTGGSIGPVLAGKIFDVTGSYSAVFQMITLTSLVSFGLMLLLRPIASKLPAPELA